MAFTCITDPEWLMALEVTPSLIQQDCKGSNFLAARFMHCKGLAACWRTTLAHKLPTDYLEKLVTYQHEIINVHQKHGYVWGRVLWMNPQSFLIWQPTMQYMWKDQNSCKNNKTWQINNCDALSFSWWQKTGPTCFAEEKESSERLLIAF